MVSILGSPESSGAIDCLEDLRMLRSAPWLASEARRRLRRQLDGRLARCHWCTIGVMAPSGSAAVATLRQVEAALGWSTLAADEPGSVIAQPVFLKGNQQMGTYSLRPEAGLGEGILITGHQPEDPEAQDTWGPLPLDFFAPDGDQGSGDGRSLG